MGQFAYDFSLMLLHSLWQSAILLLVYKVSTHFQAQRPSYRRNLLFLILIMQICISAVTYFMYAADVQTLQPAFIQISALISEDFLLQRIVPFLFSFYLLTVLYKTTVLFYHWNRFKSACRRSLIKPSVDHRLFVINKANELGITKRVKLWYSDAILTPITFGFFKPVILLPVALLTNLSVKETEMLILHELTHIKNNDYVLNFILITCETLLFFNPFIRKICNLVKLEREKNCDVAVLRSSYSSLTYAEALLKIARFKLNVSRFHLAAASDNKQLLHRVLFFTTESNLRFSKSRYAFVTYFFIAFIFLLNVLTVNQFNRKQIAGGYEYIASTIPGYNAYSLTASFNDADNLPVVDQNKANAKEMNTVSNTVIKNDHIRLRHEDKVAAAEASEPEDLYESDEVQYMPVANVTAPEAREFIFDEENSAGQKVTKAYKMIFVDGKWIVQPLWMYSESKLLGDSLRPCPDSLPRAFHIIQ